MKKNVIIKDANNLETKKKRILESGADKFHVIADFDRTLTKVFGDGEKKSW